MCMCVFAGERSFRIKRHTARKRLNRLHVERAEFHMRALIRLSVPILSAIVD